MGNNVACQTQKPRQAQSKKKQKPSNAELQIEVLQPIASVPVPKQAVEISHQTPAVNPTNCLIHQQELIKAVCITPNCPTSMTAAQQNLSRLLCCECLIEHGCASKVRTSEFVLKLRNLLSKDTLEVFLEIFDDQNQVKQDATRALTNIMEIVKVRLLDHLEKTLQELVINFYLQQSDLKSMTIEFKTMKSLSQLVDGKLYLVPAETIDLAIMCICDPKLIERLCEQIERCRSKVMAFALDFQSKFKSIVTGYVNSVKFLFELFPTQFEYISEDEVTKGTTIKKQVQQLPSQVSKNAAQSKSVVKQVAKTPEPEKKVAGNPEAPQSTLCEIHKQEIMAICVTPNCPRGRRKLCTDCLIESSECPQRMKVNEFLGKVHRILSPELLEELLVPWEDQSVLPGMKKVNCCQPIIGKVLLDGNELIRTEFNRIIQLELKNLFVRYHLIEEATPADLRNFLSKEYFKEFIAMISEGKVTNTCKGVELGVRFIITQQLVQRFLDAIVKTEQVVPQKADKLLDKLTSVTNIFNEKCNQLVDMFRTQNDPAVIGKLYQQLADEHYTLEESVCKLGAHSNTLSEWTKHLEVSPVNGLSISDICYIAEGLIALAQFDGWISLFSLPKQKTVAKLKHGATVTALVSHMINGKPILISCGFSQEQGSSIATWDLIQKQPTYQVANAHKDSIRKLKHIVVNPQLSQIFGRQGELSTQGHSSFVSMQSQAPSVITSQSSVLTSSDVRIDDTFITCSDDGSIKLWRLNSELKLNEEQLLKRPGPCVLDFTILNGCILIAACIDRSVDLSLPFTTLQHFQQIHDDSPVYCVSQVDFSSKISSSVVQKSKITTQVYQQKFITGNERGAAKIYTWQNGKAVVQKVVQLHQDRINRFLLIQTGFVASVSNDGVIVLTLVQQGKVLNTIKGHKNSITSIVYVKELQSLVTADQGGQVIVWK